MCRVSGYIGKKEALPIILDGLRRQSYGGYDSNAVLIGDDSNLVCVKAVGKLENLEKKLKRENLKGNWGIGHLRWATHGKVTEANCHPFADCQKNIFLAHNGIIENYQELKEKLIKEGHQFTSETDSEVAVHLIEKYFKSSLEEAVRKALKEIRGTYSFVIVARDDPQKIVAARLSSLLLIGINKEDNT